MCVVELKVALESCNLIFLLRIELLDCRNHRKRPAAILHTFIVPRTLKVLMTNRYRHAVFLRKLNLFCHCYHTPSGLVVVDDVTEGIA